MKRDAGNLIGQSFGRLTVTAFSHTDKKQGHIWKCRCSCGNDCEKSAGKLRDRNNPNISCGCAHADSIAKAAAAAWKVTRKFDHPLKLKIKWLYRNMVNRCYDPRNKRYDRYGGRGIRVCDEWLNDRYVFYRWCVSSGIAADLQIERKDNNGNYCPENCRFATQKEQLNNFSRNVFITWNGQTKTISQWAERLGVRPTALHHRLDRGWSMERIFTQPFRK